MFNRDFEIGDIVLYENEEKRHIVSDVTSDYVYLDGSKREDGNGMYRGNLHIIKKKILEVYGIVKFLESIEKK
jgi:hypothetical protein